MDFIWHGRRYTFRSLSPQLDAAVPQLYAAYGGGAPFNLQTLHTAIDAFLNTPGMPPDMHDAYFGSFTVLWGRFLNQGQFAQAEAIWELALEPVIAWEAAHPGHRVHKGTPFYFLGMTALLAGDIDRGYARMHDALEEDILTTRAAGGAATQLPATPAFFFVTMDARPHQAFRDWVTRQVAFIDQQLTAYRAATGRPLTLAQLQSSFLAKPPSADSIFLLAYVVGRVLQLEQLVNSARQSVFLSQLEANVFFDLTLVIDDAIKAKRAHCHFFIAQAEELSTLAGGVLNNARLGEINQAFRRDFDATLRTLLDGNFALADGTKVLGTDLDIAVAYGVRNRGAHNISGSRVIAERYNDVRASIFSALFLTIELLY